MTYTVISHRLIGRTVGEQIDDADYTPAEIDYFLKAQLIAPAQDAPKPRRRARTKTDPTEA